MGGVRERAGVLGGGGGGAYVDGVGGGCAECVRGEAGVPHPLPRDASGEGGEAMMQGEKGERRDAAHTHHVVLREHTQNTIQANQRNVC